MNLFCDCWSDTITDSISSVHIDLILFINSGDEGGVHCSQGYETEGSKFKGHEKKSIK